MKDRAMKETEAVKAPLILVVDDDLASRMLMRASLEKAGFRVEEAQKWPDCGKRFRRASARRRPS